MVIGTQFVYDAFSKTVLQCFCRTCQVSIAEKNVQSPPAASSIVRRPPTKVDYLATEVRCTEQSKGGLKYDLVLSEPAIDEAPKLASPLKINLSVEEIQNRLKAAEERRLSLEAKRLTFVTEQLCHLNEVKEKREEFNNNFIQSTRESLEQKMECNKENREAYLKSVQEKVRDHVLKVEEVKKIGNTPPRNDEVLQTIKNRLQAAQACREEQINAALERLREHDKHIENVRKQLDEAAQNLKERQSKKLEAAQEKREAMLKEIQEKNKEHEKHIAEAKKQMEDRVIALKMRHNKKLEVYKENREAKIKEIKEKIIEHDRHVEQVRKKIANASITDSSSG